MCVSRRSGLWPPMVAISLIGLGAASCTDSSRFTDSFSSNNSYSGPTGSIAQSAPASQVEAKPMPNLSGADQGSSGGGRGLGSYQPSVAAPARTTAAAPVVHSSVAERAPRAAAPNSGTHVVAPGETLRSIARLYDKTVPAIAKANNIPPDTMVRVGQRLTIPDVRVSAATPSPAPHAAAPAPAATGPDVASAESPHSARVVTPVAPAQASAVKSAEPAGGLPSFRWPVRGRIIAGFGPKPNGLQNDGINLAVPDGTPIKAAEDGVVAYAGNELKGYGNLVLLRHGNGYVTAYAHASEILVKRGEAVKRGQVIARSGETGSVTSPQLHFEIRKGATPVDPTPMLSGG